MFKKCPRCKELKELDEANFLYDKKLQRYSSYCRPCIAKYERERKTREKIKHMKKAWDKISLELNEKQADRVISDMKDIWRVNHGKCI